VITSDTGAEHKAILIDVLTQAVRDDEAAELKQRALALARGEWQQHEIAHLTSFLKDRPAKSWQQADESVMHVAAQLHREPQSVRVADDAREVQGRIEPGQAREAVGRGHVIAFPSARIEPRHRRLRCCRGLHARFDIAPVVLSCAVRPSPPSPARGTTGGRHTHHHPKESRPWRTPRT
jgi:hypothetical protein